MDSMSQGHVNNSNPKANPTASNIQLYRWSSNEKHRPQQSIPGRGAQATEVNRSGVVNNIPCSSAEDVVGEVDAGSVTDAQLLPIDPQPSELCFTAQSIHF